MKMNNKLKLIISNKIKEAFWIEFIDIKLWIPPKKNLWDYSFNSCVLSKVLKKNPNIITEELLAYFNWNRNIEFIESVSAEWPYLNIVLSKNIYTSIFNEIYNDKENYLKIEQWEWKTIIIDYIWANVWKTLHIGHMCTPNQWQVLINL